MQSYLKSFILCYIIFISQNAFGQVIIDEFDNVGIGIDNPAEKLDVDGAIRLFETINDNAGVIQFTEDDFIGFDGVDWKSLTSQIIVHSETPPTDTTLIWVNTTASDTWGILDFNEYIAEEWRPFLWYDVEEEIFSDKEVEFTYLGGQSNAKGQPAILPPAPQFYDKAAADLISHPYSKIYNDQDNEWTTIVAGEYPLDDVPNDGLPDVHDNILLHYGTYKSRECECAHRSYLNALGGASIAKWDPAADGAKLQEFIDVYNNPNSGLSTKSIRIKNLLWQHGETDQDMLYDDYSAAFNRFISELLTLGAYDPSYTQVYIGTPVIDGPLSGLIPSLDLLAQEQPNWHLIPSFDTTEVGFVKNDNVHFTSAGTEAMALKYFTKGASSNAYLSSPDFSIYSVNGSLNEYRKLYTNGNVFEIINGDTSIEEDEDEVVLAKEGSFRYSSLNVISHTGQASPVYQLVKIGEYGETITSMRAESSSNFVKIGTNSDDEFRLFANNKTGITLLPYLDVNMLKKVELKFNDYGDGEFEDEVDYLAGFDSFGNLKEVKVEQQAFGCLYTSDESIISALGAPPELIDFYTDEVFDIGDITVNKNQGKITIEIEGYYQVMIQADMDNGNASTVSTLALFKGNGTGASTQVDQKDFSILRSTGMDDNVINSEAILFLEDGDYLEVKHFKHAGSADAKADEIRFSVRKIIGY